MADTQVHTLVREPCEQPIFGYVGPLTSYDQSSLPPPFNTHLTITHHLIEILKTHRLRG